MPRYRAKEALFVDGSRLRAGDEFESSTKPGKGWEALEPKAVRGAKAAKPGKADDVVAASEAEESFTAST
jgi:hypothetical protein